MELFENLAEGLENLAIGGTVLAGTSYRSAVARVTPGKTYSIRRSTPLTNRFRAMFTKERPTHGTPFFGGTGMVSTYDLSEVIEGLVAPAGASYLFVYLSNQSESATVTVTEGATACFAAFDGDTAPEGYVTWWTGEPGASTSAMTVTPPPRSRGQA